MTSLGGLAKAPQDLAVQLERQLERTQTLLRSITDNAAGDRYAPDKWSIKQVLGHVMDMERVFGFRAFCFIRGDAGPLPGVDCDAYMSEGRFDERSWLELTSEFAAVRGATAALLRSIPQGALARSGVASDKTYSVGEIVALLGEHERHHIQVIVSRYLRDPTRAETMYREAEA